MNNQSYTYKYERPALTADCVIFGFNGSDLLLLLIERGIKPYLGKWALPGGFIRINETAEECARRELKEETGLENVFMEQLYTFSSLYRDPRERVVTIAFYALVKPEMYLLKAGDDARNAKWFEIQQLPELAFDHLEIIRMAINRIKGKIRYQPIGFELLPEKFTLTQLQKLYELILETQIDKRNFRKKILNTKILIPLDEKQEKVKHKAARYYKFDTKKYRELTEKGFNFEI